MDVDDLAGFLGLPDLATSLIAVEETMRELATDAAPLIQPGLLRVVRGGGKRLRPVLTIAAAGCRGLPERVRLGAVSVELVHAGSLVHDDIIDHAGERRGVPTINSVEGVNTAILAGDVLLGKAGQAAATVSREVARVLADTIIDLCDGQARETVDLYNADRTHEDMLLSIRGKTAALMRASCRIGGLAGEQPEEITEALTVFGENFGMAFQLLDDVLDFASNERLLGKPVGNDVREGVYSLPVLVALDADPDRLRPLLHPAITAEEAAEVVALVRANGGLTATVEAARDFNRTAVEALTQVGPPSVFEGLATLPSRYLDWTMAEKFDPAFVGVGSA